MIFNEQETTLKIRKRQKYMKAIKVFTLVSLFVSFAILIASTVLALTPTSFELDSSNVTHRVGFWLTYNSKFAFGWLNVLMIVIMVLAILMLSVAIYFNYFKAKIGYLTKMGYFLFFLLIFGLIFVLIIGETTTINNGKDFFMYRAIKQETRTIYQLNTVGILSIIFTCLIEASIVALAIPYLLKDYFKVIKPKNK